MRARQVGTLRVTGPAKNVLSTRHDKTRDIGHAEKPHLTAFGGQPPRASAVEGERVELSWRLWARPRWQDVGATSVGKGTLGDRLLETTQFHPDAQTRLDRGREGLPLPALRTVRAVFPHTALQSVVSSSGVSRYNSGCKASSLIRAKTGQPWPVLICAAAFPVL